MPTTRWRTSSRPSLARAIAYIGASIAMVAVAVAVPTPAFAAATVTAASGGTSLSAATAAPSGAFTTLGSIVIDEQVAGEVGEGRLAIRVPAGFEFSTVNTATVALGGGSPTNRLRMSASSSCTSLSTSSITVTPTASALTFYVCQASTTDTIITISGIRVRPSASTPLVGGNLYLDNTAGATTITGVTGGVGGTNFGSLAMVAANASQLVPTLPASVTAGSTQTVTVTAKDPYGNTATGYRGAVRFTSTDPAAVLPANYTFTAADNGEHTFTNGVTLKTAGARSVSATDTVTASVTGVASTTVAAASASALTLTGIANPLTAGASASATVTARDAYGNVAPGYTGTVHFTSTDAAATLPADYTFTGADAGTRTFTGLVLRTAGNQGVSVGDGTRSATQSPITVQPGALHHLALSPSTATVTAGGSRAFTAQGRDVNDNSLGDVTAGTTFTISPNGSCTGNSCSATVAGSHTVTGTNGGATGTATMNVQPAAAVVSLALSPSTIVADGTATSTVTVTVADQYGNARANDTVDVSTDGDAAVSTVVNNGDGTYTATLTASTVAGTQTITAADGDQSATAVLTQVPGAASEVTLVLTPDAVEADGISTSNALITVMDAFGNTRDDDVVTLVSNGDATVSEVTSIGFGAYVAVVTASTTPGTETLTATSGPASATADLIELGQLSVAGISPGSRGQGANGGAWGQVVTVSGTGFSPGSQTDFGPGVTVKFTTVVDATQLRAHIVVAPDAEIGSRSVTVTVDDGRSVTCEACFAVTAGPSLAVASPIGIGPGAQRTVTLSGANFHAGVKVTVPGTGVAVTSVNRIDATQIGLGLSTAFAATAGARDIVVTNLSDGGSTVCSGCLVVTVGPTVSETSPNVLGGGALTTVTVTGANFDSGARLSVAGTGVAVMSQTRLDDTRLVATLSVAGAATAGARVVSVVNGDGGRGSCATCFAVSAAPTVTGITPTSLVRGTSAQVTITGTNFGPGATVGLSTGVTVSDVTVVDGSTITATVSVSATTGAGSRTVLVTNADYGKGSCAGCFAVTR